MKVKFIGKTTKLGFTSGGTYPVISVEKVGNESWYRIIDGTEEDYLYPSELFEIVEE
jgi:hypothetical protein